MEKLNEVMCLMKDIEYGWLDKIGNKYYQVDSNFSDSYILQTPEEVIKNKIGVCWDQVELERYYFANENIKTYFLVYYDNDRCPTHTFLTYENNNKIYWFEHSWEKYRGIHEYNSLKDLLKDVKNKFIKDELNNQCNDSNLVINIYDKPKSHISCLEFCQHCEQK